MSGLVTIKRFMGKKEMAYHNDTAISFLFIPVICADVISVIKED